MKKNLPKLVKYIFPSDKQWTGVWSAGYRGLHLPCASIDNRVDIDVILVKIIYIIMLNVCSQQERHTKVPPVMSIFWALGKRPEPESWVCGSSTTKAEKNWRKQLTEEFRSKSVASSMKETGKEGENGFRLIAAIC